MKIQLIKYTWRWQEGKKPEYFGSSYHYLPLEYCCDDLRDNEDDNIELTSEAENQGDDTYYYPTFAIAKEITQGDWEDMWEETILTPIRFCPYCGEPFEFELLQTEDKSDVLRELNNQLDKVMAKHSKTDSIKTRDKLQTEINALWDKITSMQAFGPHQDIKMEEEDEKSTEN